MPKITLKAARINAGLTQEEVAQKLQRTKQTVINWESGVTAVRHMDLLRLSELYQMPVEYLNLPEKKRRKIRKESPDNAKEVS